MQLLTNLHDRVTEPEELTGLEDVTMPGATERLPFTPPATDIPIDKAFLARDWSSMVMLVCGKRIIHDQGQANLLLKRQGERWQKKELDIKGCQDLRRGANVGKIWGTFGGILGMAGGMAAKQLPAMAGYLVAGWQGNFPDAAAGFGELPLINMIPDLTDAATQKSLGNKLDRFAPQAAMMPQSMGQMQEKDWEGKGHLKQGHSQGVSERLQGTSGTLQGLGRYREGVEQVLGQIASKIAEADSKIASAA